MAARIILIILARRRWLRDGPQVTDDRHAFCAQTFFLDELGSEYDDLRRRMERDHESWTAGAMVATGTAPLSA